MQKYRLVAKHVIGKKDICVITLRRAWSLQRPLFVYPSKAPVGGAGEAWVDEDSFKIHMDEPSRLEVDVAGQGILPGGLLAKRERRRAVHTHWAMSVAGIEENYIEGIVDDSVVSATTE